MEYIGSTHEGVLHTHLHLRIQDPWMRVYYKVESLLVGIRTSEWKYDEVMEE